MGRIQLLLSRGLIPGLHMHPVHWHQCNASCATADAVCPLVRVKSPGAPAGPLLAAKPPTHGNSWPNDNFLPLSTLPCMRAPLLHPKLGPAGCCCCGCCLTKEKALVTRGSGTYSSIKDAHQTHGKGECLGPGAAVGDGTVRLNMHNQGERHVKGVQLQQADSTQNWHSRQVATQRQCIKARRKAAATCGVGEGTC